MSGGRGQGAAETVVHCATLSRRRRRVASFSVRRSGVNTVITSSQSSPPQSVTGHYGERTVPYIELRMLVTYLDQIAPRRPEQLCFLHSE